ncbi:hypothetical protein B0H13DRAFT_2341987 [Mycena leptocephala]|nr:hypothetical protein B0H13DRAFT_2341987 [Mycena leptocephala]
MVGYILKSLDTSQNASMLSSLVFNSPFPENVSRQFLDRYQAMRTERQLDEESHYDEASGLLVLEVYNEDGIQTQQELWTERATPQFREIVNADKTTPRHVELILPTGGIATPLNLLGSVKEITNLESLCIQWVPIARILPYDHPSHAHILDESTIANFARFHGDLMDLLAARTPSLKRLRISLPESTTRKPFSALSINTSGPYWHPTGPFPTSSASSSITAQKYRRATSKGMMTRGSQSPTRGPLSVRTSLRTPLLCARCYPWAPVGSRLTQGELRDLLRSGGRGDSSGVDRLVLCTAWPIAYEAREKGPGEAPAHSEDLYEYAQGCRHLAYPADQRPTTGLWPANTAEARATQTRAERPWY